MGDGMRAKKIEDKKVSVTAVKNDKMRWVHQGVEMAPGDTAEVTPIKAAKLKQQGLIK